MLPSRRTEMRSVELIDLRTAEGEPPARSRFELTIGGKDAGSLRIEVEHALERKGVNYELLGSSAHELHYEVIVPFHQKILTLTKMIRGLDDLRGTSVEWDIKKHKMVKS